MNPTEAIDTLEFHLQPPCFSSNHNLKTAIQLGLEALHRLQTMRSFNINQAIMPLPSERSIEDPSLSTDQLKRINESPLVRRDML